MKSDDALATILLVSRIASDGTNPLTARQFWRLMEQVGKPGRLLGMTEDDLVGSGRGADMANRVASLLARASAMAFELERLDQSGMATLTPFDPTYPQRFRTNLGPKAPPILHAAGALDLLNKGGVGVVGSRNVSEEGAKVAAALGRQAASLNVPLISGAARGVDQRAMNAAYKAGGPVISVPAHSLFKTLKSPGLPQAFAEPFTPAGPSCAHPTRRIPRSQSAKQWAATSSSTPSRSDCVGRWRPGFGRHLVRRRPGPMGHDTSSPYTANDVLCT